MARLGRAQRIQPAIKRAPDIPATPTQTITLTGITSQESFGKVSGNPLNNTLEGGSNGVSISPANSGGTSGTPCHYATNTTYSTTTTYHGNVTAKSTTAGGSAAYVEWDAGTYLGASTVSGSPAVYARAYFMVPALPSTGTTVQLMSITDGTGPWVGEVRIDDQGRLGVYNSNPTLVGGPTTAITPGSWFRLEFGVLAFSDTVGQLQLKLFTSPESSTGVTVSSATTVDTANGAGMYVLFGITTTYASAYTVYFDDISVSTIGYPGGIGQTMYPAGIPSLQAFGQDTVSLAAGGDQTITAAGIDSRELFGNNPVTPGYVAVGGRAVNSAEAFGNISVTTGPVTITASGIPSQEAFGSATASLSVALTITATGISSAADVGNNRAVPGAMTVTTAGIDSRENLGEPTVASIATISPKSITSLENVSSVAASPGAVTITGSGIASQERLGSSAVSPGAVSITPVGVATSERFGNPATQNVSTISPTSIVSLETFGNATASPGAVTISPKGIESREGVGNANTSGIAAQQVTVTGISGQENFGAISTTIGAATILPIGIGSASDVGAATVSTTNTISAVGIHTQERLGNSTFTRVISPVGIDGSGPVGSVTITAGAVTITVKGIVSQQDIGNNTVFQTGPGTYIYAKGIPSVADVGQINVSRTADFTSDVITTVMHSHWDDNEIVTDFAVPLAR